MTNTQVHEELILWLGELLALTVIKDRQQADRPARPYGMVDLVNWDDIDENVSNIKYTDTVIEGEPAVIVTPETPREWVFLFFVYGDNADVFVNRLKSAVQLRQQQEPLLALGLVVHNVGRVNSVPELIDEVWEPRTQVNIVVHGISSESFEDGYVIEEIEIVTTGERA